MHCVMRFSKIIIQMMIRNNHDIHKISLDVIIYRGIYPAFLVIYEKISVSRISFVFMHRRFSFDAVFDR